MLDKTAYKILGIIASMSSDGENLVVNKGEIISLVDVELSSDELDKIIEALEVNDMLSVLYSDSGMYCIAVRPKGKLIAEKNKKAEEMAIAAAEEEKREAESISEIRYAETREQQQPIDVRKFAVICAVSSFLGGFLAAMITFLVTLFK